MYRAIKSEVVKPIGRKISIALSAGGVATSIHRRSTLCPVRGYDLGFQAWDGDSPSDEVCLSCGIQFGYSDATGGDPVGRQAGIPRVASAMN